MKKLMILSYLFLIVSCNSNKIDPQENIAAEKIVLDNKDQATLGLYIKTSTTIGKITSDTLTKITSDYFEVTLGSVRGKGYSAGKTIEEATSMENFRFIFFAITDKDGNALYFKSSADFLNYMSERGYEMADQVKNKYGADYTFKKK